MTLFGFLSLSVANAASLEVLVKTLEEKGVLTPREAEVVLNSSGDRVSLLAEILKQKGILTESEVKKIETPAGKRVAALPQGVSPQTRTGGEKDRLKTLRERNLQKLSNLSISGVAYVHYDYTIKDTDRTNDGSNAFKVNRAYLTVKRYFDAPENYFRLTADVYTDDSGNNNYRLKYAYLNWKVGENAQAEIGLVHRPWLDWEEHNGWLHREITNSFIEDRYGAHLITSADYGVALKGKAGEWGYLFGIYNGEGYHSVDDDRHFGKAVAGRINRSFGGWTFALHALYNDNDNTDDGRADQFVLHPYLMYKNDRFLVALQYIYDREFNYYDRTGDKHSFTNEGWSVNGDLYLKSFVGKPITLFGRYGFWNFDGEYTALNSANLNAYDRTQYLFGVSYDLNPFVRISLADQIVKYDDAVKKNNVADRDYKHVLMGVMKVKW